VPVPVLALGICTCTCTCFILFLQTRSNVDAPVTQNNPVPTPPVPTWKKVPRFPGKTWGLVHYCCCHYHQVLKSGCMEEDAQFSWQDPGPGALSKPDQEQDCDASGENTVDNLTHNPMNCTCTCVCTSACTWYMYQYLYMFHFVPSDKI
jgi:hypothetical protein